MVNDGASEPWPRAASRIAPLEDEDMLAAVQRGLGEVVVPALVALGADDFVVSQCLSIMSMVGFVKRGLLERQLARADCDAALAAVAGPDRSPSDEATKAIVRRRLEADIAGRASQPR